MGVTNVEPLDILIYPSPGTAELEALYHYYLAANIEHAYEGNLPFTIGLEAVIFLIERLFEQEGYRNPDILFVETSLAPESVRLAHTNVILDFYQVAIYGCSDIDIREALRQRINDTYSLVYSAVHNKNVSTYHTPEFFKVTTKKEMLFSRYDQLDERSVTYDVYDKINRNTRVGTIASAIQEIKEGKGTAGREANNIHNIDQWAPVANPDPDVRYMFQRRYELMSDPKDRMEVEEYRKIQLESTEESIRKCRNLRLMNADVLHTFLHQEALSDTENKDLNFPKSYLWCIPILGAANQTESKPGWEWTRPQLMPLGALFILMAYKDVEHFQEITDKCAAKIGRILSYTISDYYTAYLYYTTQDAMHKAIRKSTGAAVAGIMARNMSHNIGSHVSARATVTEVERRLDKLCMRLASKE